MGDTSPQEDKKIPPEHIEEYVWIIWAMASEQTQIPKEIRAHRTLHTHLKEMRMSSFHLHSGATMASDGGRSHVWRTFSCGLQNTEPTLSHIPFLPLLGSFKSFVHSVTHTTDLHRASAMG